MEGTTKSFFKSSTFYWAVFLTVAFIVGGFFYFETMKPEEVEWELGRTIYRSGLKHDLKDLKLERNEDNVVVVDKKNGLQVTIGNEKEGLSVERIDSEEGLIIDFSGNANGVSIYITEKRETEKSVKEYVDNRIKLFENSRNGIEENIYEEGSSQIGNYIVTTERQGPYPVYYNLYLEIPENQIFMISSYSLENIKYILKNLSLLN